MAYANRGEVDEQMAYELDGYIQSDGDLYRQKYLPIVKNLVNKMAQGKYDRGMAIKAFMYLVDDGAKKFHREFNYNVPWNVMANKATREEVAKSIRDSFEVEARLGNWDQLLTKVSAAKRAKSSANRSMGARGTGGRRPSNTKSAAKARLLKAWRNQHKGKARGSEVADAMQGAFDAGMTQNEIDSVMDRASGGKSFNVGRIGEPGYRSNRSGTAKPRPYGTDRDRFHGNPNARKSRNKSGPRKTRDEYQVQVNYGYGHGWEHEISEDTLAAARERRKEYQANTNYPVRIQKKRVKL